LKKGAPFDHSRCGRSLVLGVEVEEIFGRKIPLDVESSFPTSESGSGTSMHLFLAFLGFLFHVFRLLLMVGGYVGSKWWAATDFGWMLILGTGFAASQHVPAAQTRPQLLEDPQISYALLNGSG
jgi:hypothetical protein